MLKIWQRLASVLRVAHIWLYFWLAAGALLVLNPFSLTAHHIKVDVFCGTTITIRDVNTNISYIEMFNETLAYSCCLLMIYMHLILLKFTAIFNFGAKSTILFLFGRFRGKPGRATQHTCAAAHRLGTTARLKSYLNLLHMHEMMLIILFILYILNTYVLYMHISV
jgi:hypothetical protein